MGKLISECELRREAAAGAGSGNTWDDILTLGRRTDGSYRVRLRRNPNDYYLFDDRIEGPSTLYCSPPFRTPERLLQLLLDTPTPRMEQFCEWPRFELPDVLAMIAEVIEFDARFGLAVLKALAVRITVAGRVTSAAGDTGGLLKQ